jgi:hypothetical protein
LLISVFLSFGFSACTSGRMTSLKWRNEDLARFGASCGGGAVEGQKGRSWLPFHACQGEREVGGTQRAE